MNKFVAKVKLFNMSYYVIYKSHGSTVCFGLILALLSSFGQSYFIALFVPDIQREYVLSHVQIGSIFSLATLSSGFVMIFAGALIDQLKVHSYATIALTGLAFACFVMSFPSGVVILTFTIAALRLFGQGMLSHAAITSTARLPAPIRGRAIGIAALGFPIGAGLAPTVGIALIAGLGWVETWRISGAVILACIMILVVVFRSEIWSIRPSQGRSEANNSDDCTKVLRRRDVVRDWRFWLMIPAIVASPAISTGYLFEQRYIGEERGWSLEMIAFGMSAYAVSSVFGSVAGGSAIDWMGAKRVTRVFLLPMAFASASLVVFADPLLAPFFFAGIGLTVGASQVVVTAALADLYGTTQLGMVRSIAASIMVIGSALTPALFGAFIDAGVSFMAIGSGCALYLITASILSVLVRS